MTWRPIDFQGIITFDQGLVEQLRKYLAEKENELSYQMIHVLEKEAPRTPSPEQGGSLILRDAIDELGRQIRNTVASKKDSESKRTPQEAVVTLNGILWEYVEMLEGFVAEMFYQLSQTKFESWSAQLVDAVTSLKELLVQRIEDLIWGIRRMEKHLWELRWQSPLTKQSTKGFFRRMLIWRGLLDPSLLRNLKKSEEYLNSRYRSFIERYEEYEKLGARLNQSIKRFEHHRIYLTLNADFKEKFLRVYRLLKLWRLNRKHNHVLGKEPARILRNFLSVDKVFALFQEYFEGLKNELFERGREFKRGPRTQFEDEKSREEIKQLIEGYRSELHCLGSTVAKYREFLLRTDPDPYVRSRWGFTEWVVGEEPDQSRKLMQLGYDIENFDDLYEKLIQSLDVGVYGMKGNRLAEIKKSIQKCLHEMGQPLISRHMMYTRAETILLKLDEIDELGSFKPDIVEYVGKVFSKALRLDWKYHVFHEISLFHKLYTIHQGIVGSILDHNHTRRMNKFRDCIKEISKWVKNNDVGKHAHELEQDIHDIKEYMQDFLTDVQRLAKDKTLDKKKVKEMCTLSAQELLEYRYLFGGFFHFLEQNDPDQELDRSHFLFVNQYFESVENRIYLLAHRTI